MRENFTYGSVRGAAGDGSPYRDSTSVTVHFGHARNLAVTSGFLN
ncbi:hypothetical protein Poly51_30860 [Rubripirellula tenax]|uniref:Uncharacterized protein n=1 Tax=Rubripirellula tenax TaxID=2528015 RepID=A0A5C6F3K7_9BACT|nr:hypothetical protein Poly51_30860 [Rubripirellula tenax]